MTTLADICEETGVEIIDIRHSRSRRPGQTCAERTLQKLLDKHGAGHMRYVLSTIVETTNNKLELVAPVIHAISDIVLDYPEWADQASLWLETFDRLDIALMRKHLKDRRRGNQRQRIYDAILNELEAVFAPIKQKDFFT